MAIVFSLGISRSFPQIFSTHFTCRPLPCHVTSRGGTLKVIGDNSCIHSTTMTTAWNSHGALSLTEVHIFISHGTFSVLRLFNLGILSGTWICFYTDFLHDFDLTRCRTTTICSRLTLSALNTSKTFHFWSVRRKSDGIYRPLKC